ncbi:MAG: RnfABCDGE type electron transport complex subunit D [Marinifilaceae bacterium]|jgi:electron transport complex protein RnfD|nr:RnfABCDGE type electron transport complex subunit D [Marinifilaceae bacterium]
MNKIFVSPSPHIHSGDSIKKNMWGVVIATVPAMILSFVYFGINALFATLTAVLSCILFEYLIKKFLLKEESSITDGSAIITGILLAFNVPSSLPLWIIVIGALVAIGIGKLSYGGLGNNVFNPALVGRVFLLISFPAQMTSWPVPTTRLSEKINPDMIDSFTGATPLAMLQEGIQSGQSVSSIMEQNNFPTYQDMLLGNIGGSLGEVAAIAIIAGLIFMLVRKIITWHIPTAIILTVVAFTGILNLCSPDTYADPLFHLLTGGLLLGAVFMATDYVTSPMSKKGMLVYGVGIGLLTVIIRIWGSYPEGMSFAILIMNAFTPLINKYFKPKRFGIAKKGGKK